MSLGPRHPLMVPMGRIELPTSPLPRGCSTTEPHGPRSVLGAGNEARTRDLNLGKVALYQLSYSRACAWWLPDLGSNQGPTD